MQHICALGSYLCLITDTLCLISITSGPSDLMTQRGQYNTAHDGQFGLHCHLVSCGQCAPFLPGPCVMSRVVFLFVYFQIVYNLLLQIGWP